ncbi:Hypothetical predicted protein [Marmota monax]|uniref:Uncharacterized protein n=1 Tax=Marmota monax TaxID=9995 RepID=A0A5E4AS28_MARMO|nr:Hypothetical predicted protein [Marmota monax]
MSPTLPRPYTEVAPRRVAVASRPLGRVSPDPQTCPECRPESTQSGGTPGAGLRSYGYDLHSVRQGAIEVRDPLGEERDDGDGVPGHSRHHSSCRRRRSVLRQSGFGKVGCGRHRWEDGDDTKYDLSGRVRSSQKGSTEVEGPATVSPRDLGPFVPSPDDRSSFSRRQGLWGDHVGRGRDHWSRVSSRQDDKV